MAARLLLLLQPISLPYEYRAAGFQNIMTSKEPALTFGHSRGFTRHSSKNAEEGQGAERGALRGQEGGKVGCNDHHRPPRASFKRDGSNWQIKSAVYGKKHKKALDQSDRQLHVTVLQAQDLRNVRQGDRACKNMDVFVAFSFPVKGHGLQIKSEPIFKGHTSPVLRHVACSICRAFATSTG